MSSAVAWCSRLLFHSRCEGLSCEGSQLTAWFLLRSDAIAKRCLMVRHVRPWKRGIEQSSGSAFPNPKKSKKHLQSLAPQMNILNCKAHGKKGKHISSIVVLSCNGLHESLKADRSEHLNPSSLKYVMQIAIITASSRSCHTSDVQRKKEECRWVQSCVATLPVTSIE